MTVTLKPFPLMTLAAADFWVANKVRRKKEPGQVELDV